MCRVHTSCHLSSEENSTHDVTIVLVLTRRHDQESFLFLQYINKI